MSGRGTRLRGYSLAVTSQAVPAGRLPGGRSRRAAEAGPGQRRPAGRPDPEHGCYSGDGVATRCRRARQRIGPPGARAPGGALRCGPRAVSPSATRACGACSVGKRSGWRQAQSPDPRG